jgi:transposase
MLHVGIDMHKHFSELAVLDDDRTVVDRRRLDHRDRAGLQQYFRRLARPATVTLEATRSWYWLFELLEAEGLPVKLAHPLKVRLIAEARIKTDAIDALTLAELERAGFLPEAYIPPRDVRDQRELLRYRLGLVWTRTGLKNRVHALLDKLGIGHDFTDLFGRAGRRFLAAIELRDVYRQALDGYLAGIDFLTDGIAAATRSIRAALKQDPRAELLLTVPGIGELTAHLLLCEIGDIARFPSAKRLCAYSGLVPRTYQSGSHCWQGEITRQGDRYIRWAMVEAAYQATRQDMALADWYRRLKLKKGAAVARVAVARKLLYSVWYVLTRQEPYRFRPLRMYHPGKPEPVAGQLR